MRVGKGDRGLPRLLPFGLAGERSCAGSVMPTAAVGVSGMGSREFSHVWMAFGCQYARRPMSVGFGRMPSLTQYSIVRGAIDKRSATISLVIGLAGTPCAGLIFASSIAAPQYEYARRCAIQ